MARTNYFVDASATGAGTGVDPANAFVSIQSVPFVTVNTIDITAWVRRTHQETLAPSLYFGTHWAFDDFPNWHAIVGWPNSGDPQYTNRPVAGQSVWDADVAGHTVGSLGGNVPTFTYSFTSGAGPLFGEGFFANIALQNEGGIPSINRNTLTGFKYQTHLDNLWLLGPTASGGKVRTAPGSLWGNVGKLTMVFSSGLSGDAIFINDSNGPFDVRHMVVHSATISASGGFFRNAQAGQAIHIGLFQIDTTSVGFWTSDSTARGSQAANASNRIPVWIERVVGQKTAVGHVQNVSALVEMRVDDWYGEGPVLWQTYDVMTRVASSGEAQHNSKSAVYTATGSRLASGSFTWMSFNNDSARWPDIRKKFDVVSGTPITINLPAYVSSTAIYSLSLGHARGGLNCMGGDAVYTDSTNLIPGSYTNWTGSLIAGGSAYVAQFTFTPKETGTFEFEYYKGWVTEANSHTNLVGYLLIGEPEV